jgi:hypothetical protein
MIVLRRTIAGERQPLPFRAGEFNALNEDRGARRCLTE